MTGPKTHTALALGLCVVGCSLAGCASARDPAVHEASQLRVQVPRLLRTEPRRGLLYAVASQRLDPTSAGSWLLADADQQFSGVAKVLPLSGASTVAAMRLTTGIITATSAPSLQTWSADSGALLGTVMLPRQITRIAASVSPYLTASADAAGDISLWDTEHLSHPAQTTLPRTPVAGRVVALGFAAASTRLLAVTSTGNLIEYDVLHRKLITAPTLSAMIGKLKVGTHLEVTAGYIAEQEYSSETTVLLAARGVGVVRVDPVHLNERLEIPAREIEGDVTALATYPNSPHAIYLGTNEGTASWSGRNSAVVSEFTGKSSGLALQGSTLFAANEQGLAAVNYSEAASGERFSNYTGRPVRDLISGPGGTLALDRDGTISLLNEGESGINLKTTAGEASLVASFGPDESLLEATGFDASHVNELVALRPGLVGPLGGDDEPNRIVHRYMPASSWWPAEATGQHGLFIDDVELTKRYALAGGQDPTGTAVVLVWDAHTGQPLRRLSLAVPNVNQEYLQNTTPSLVSEVTELPKRHLIAAYSALQELIVLWSTRSWQRVMTIDVGPIGGFAVDSRESTLLVDSLSDKQSELQAGNSHTTLQFIDLGTGKVKRGSQ